MYENVGIADQQKAQKKGRDDSIKQFSNNPTLHIFNVERYVGWSYVLNCFICHVQYSPTN